MGVMAASKHRIAFPLQASLATLLQPWQFLKRYSWRDLPSDAIAGLTTGVILVPQSIAYAHIAGLPATTGLYTAVIAAITAALWGSSRHLHTGPTNAASLLVLATVAPIVTSNNVQEYLIAAGMLSALVGVLRLGIGLLRLGFVVNFVSDAVMVGFTAGAGMLIITNQLSGLLGMEAQVSAQFAQTFQNLWAQSGPVHVISLLLGLATLLLIVVLPQVHRRIPSQFVALVVTSLVIMVFRLDQVGVRLIEEIPRGFPPWQALPLTNWDLIQKLIPGAGAIAIIGLIEALTISRSLATESGQYLDNNQEIVGQGIANIVCGFFSGYTSSGSFTRSTINYTSGGRTQMTSILSGLFVMGAVLGLGFFIQFLSRPVLAGFVIATAISMISYKRARQILETSKSETFIMLATFLSAFILPLVYVVTLGIITSLVVYVYKTSRPRVLNLVPTTNFRHLREASAIEDSLCPQLSILSVEGDLYFGAANHVEFLLRNHLPPPDTRRFVLLQLQNTVRIDVSGVRMLENFVRSVRQRGGDVYFFKITDLVFQVFQSSGFIQYVGDDHFLHEDTAIDFLFHQVLNPKVCIYDCPHRVFQECINLPKIAIPFQDILQREEDSIPVDMIKVEQVEHRLMIQDRSLAIIDVRERLEWDRGHIPQAHHLPYSTFNPLNHTLQREEIVLVSNTSRRARNIARVLQHNGFDNVKVLDGGMIAWSKTSNLLALTEYRS